LISTGAETESARFRCAASRNRRHIFTMAGLLTLEDTVEFFNLVMELRPSAQEKKIWWHSYACSDVGVEHV
jgi:hypothetical protein